MNQRKTGKDNRKKAIRQLDHHTVKLLDAQSNWQYIDTLYQDNHIGNKANKQKKHDDGQTNN